MYIFFLDHLDKLQSISLFGDSLFVNPPTCKSLFVTPKLMFAVLSWSFADAFRATKNLSSPSCTFPAETEQGDALLPVSVFMPRWQERGGGRRHLCVEQEALAGTSWMDYESKPWLLPVMQPHGNYITFLKLIVSFVK